MRSIGCAALVLERFGARAIRGFPKQPEASRAQRHVRHLAPVGRPCRRVRCLSRLVGRDLRGGAGRHVDDPHVARFLVDIAFDHDDCASRPGKGLAGRDKARGPTRLTSLPSRSKSVSWLALFSRICATIFARSTGSRGSGWASPGRGASSRAANSARLAVSSWCRLMCSHGRPQQFCGQSEMTFPSGSVMVRMRPE